MESICLNCGKPLEMKKLHEDLVVYVSNDGYLVCYKEKIGMTFDAKLHVPTPVEKLATKYINL